LRAAYALGPRSGLLFNTGTTLDRLHRSAEAIAAYERYLAAVPEVENRSAVEARLTELRSVPEAGGPRAGEVEVPVGGWVVLGTGAVLAAAGAVLLGVGAVDASAVTGAPLGTYWSQVSGAYERAEAESIAGAVLLGVGGAAAVAGLVWVLVPAGEGQEAAAQVTLAPSPGGLVAMGTF